MKQENEDYLKQVYPKIFPADWRGFECSDGWFNIINIMCRNAQSYLNWKSEVPQVVVSQVKEKYGSLRFYYDGGDEYIAGLISMAEAISEVTCEICGEPGQTRQVGWHKVLCDTHAKEREKARNDTPR
jgi:hypothetical protein